MAATTTATSNGVVKQTRKRGPNKDKPRDFSIARSGDKLTLTIGDVQIPGLTSEQVKDLVWNNAMQGGSVLLTVTVS